MTCKGMLNRSLQRSHNCELIRIEKNTSPADTFAFKSLFGLVGRGEPGQRALPSWHRPGLPKSLAAAPRRPFVTLRLVEVGVSSVGHMKAQMWELGVRLGRSSLEVGHGRALTRCFVAKRPSLVRSHPAPAWRRLLLLLRRHRDSLTALDLRHGQLAILQIAWDLQRTFKWLQPVDRAARVLYPNIGRRRSWFAGGVEASSVHVFKNLNFFDLGQTLYMFATMPNHRVSKVPRQGCSSRA